MITEKSTEKQLTQKLKDEGWLCIKFTSPNFTGVPDRIALKDGKIIFIEVKSPKGRLSKRQTIVINQLDAMGFPCFVVKNEKDMLKLLNYVKSL